MWKYLEQRQAYINIQLVLILSLQVSYYGSTRIQALHFPFKWLKN